MKRIWQFIRNWTLPLAMMAGVAEYFLFVNLPLDGEVRHQTYLAVTHYIQPILIFTMLFLSLIKVSPKEMRPHRWQAMALSVQTLLFVGFSILAMFMPDEESKVLCEGAMLSLVCPTATASAVVTSKLGGSVSGVVTYLMLCNLMTSVAAPLFFPMVEPSEVAFFDAFLTILGKVFPLLICPLALAWIVRFLMRPVHRWLLKFKDLAFYMWAVSLSLAIAVTVRSIVHTSVSIWYLVGLAVVSGLCCLLQFYLGRRIGARFGENEKITAGQAFGQKNTVFIIWMGQVFLNPVTSVVGGFYSVWHNTVNAYQLYKVRKAGQ